MQQKKKTIKNQDKKTVTITGVFDGYDEEDGYSFLIKNKEDGSENYIFIEAITDEVLKAINLKSASFVGKTFEITYQVTEYEEEDEDGNIETYEKFTIVKLKKL